MSFINALVVAAKNAGISSGELYAQANRLRDKTPKAKHPLRGTETRISRFS